jgi:hypothetical protein
VSTVAKIAVLGMFAAALALPQAVPMEGQYNSSLPTLSNTNYSIVQVDSSGRLIVNCGSGCGGSGGTSIADEATFTQGTTSITPIGGIYTTSITSLTSGQAGVALLTAKRAVVVNAQMSNNCGDTYYNPAPQFLPSTSTAVTSTTTCVYSLFFTNTDTAVHTVNLVDQSTNCNSAACNFLTSYPLPPNTGWMRVELDGAQLSGGFKWSADTANKVIGVIVGNQ